MERLRRNQVAQGSLAPACPSTPGPDGPAGSPAMELGRAGGLRGEQLETPWLDVLKPF